MPKMHVFKCVVCGKLGVSNRLGRLYCSQKCGVAAYRRKNNQGAYSPEYICNYNEGVKCTRQSCAGCGWNPDVAKERMGMLVE